MIRAATDAPVPSALGGHRRAILTVVAAGGLVAIAAFLLVTGSKTALAMALAIAGAPVLLYLAIKRPFIFPFGLYAVLVPFEHLVVIQRLGTLTKLAGILASIAFIFYIIRTKQIVKPPRVLYAWLAFVTWVCASTIWAVDPAESLSLINTLLQLFALFAVTTLVPIRRGELNAVLLLVALGGIAAAAYGDKMFLSGAQMQGSRLFLESSQTGNPLDPNHFAASLLLPIAVVLGYTLRTRRILLKIAAFAGLGVLLLGVYASSSRGALVALGAVLLTMLWRTRRWLELGAVIILATILGAAAKSAVWERFLQDPSGGSGRNTIWSIGMHAFMQRPLFGWGIGNFPDAYNRWLLQLYSSYFPKWNRAPHDLVVMIAVELGIVGLVLMAWVVYDQARTVRTIPPSSSLYHIRVMLEAAFVGLLVVSLFLDTLYWKYAWLTFIVLVLARTVSLAPGSDVEQQASAFSTPGRRADGFAFGLVRRA